MKKIIFLTGVLFLNGVSGMHLTLSKIRGLPLEEIKGRLSDIVQYSGNEYFKEVALPELESLNQNANLISDHVFLSGVSGLFDMVGWGDVDDFLTGSYDRVWGGIDSFTGHDLPVIRERATVILQKFYAFGRNLVLDKQLVSLHEITCVYKSVLSIQQDATKDSQTVSQAQEILQRIAGGSFDNDTIIAARDFCGVEREREAREERAEQLTGKLEKFKKIEGDLYQWDSFFNPKSTSFWHKVSDPMRLVDDCIEDLCQQRRAESLDFSDAKAKISSVGAVEMILDHIENSSNNRIFRRFITLLNSYEEEYKQRLFREFSDAFARAVYQQDRLPSGLASPELVLFGTIYQTFLLFPR
ncbi:MAG: hypothetical protein LBJ71_02145 [Holosporaceae bacterium]|jgi:hypothetical protein|nr:hypothetical protein [Holosporaceae bacterium]